MTVERTRHETAAVLARHHVSTALLGYSHVRCSCGERLVSDPYAMAKHQAVQLMLSDLLAPDPTGPLSSLSLAALEPGEVVFDNAGVAWMHQGRHVWFTYDQTVPYAASNEADLLAERGPLTLYRAPATVDLQDPPPFAPLPADAVGDDTGGDHQ